ncbi:uncharacterized protein LOC6547439 [Drosophila erecta]|uniref:Uncharacterized protein n=1 Tax=Drosophila erecta TaxID=7220 RepID=B3NPB2_DROER|nr:uncharacterized protein LOC6547439 [Drosophila erecta]EDV56775.2 uncharacterized protein Dere_GG20049 [Drosophila erecta]
MMRIHRLLMNKCTRYGHVLRHSMRVPRGHHLSAPLQVRHGSQEPRKAVPMVQISPGKKLDIEVDFFLAKDKPQQVSLPTMIYFYSPLSRLTTMLALLRLKLLWDWDFSEQKFIENSRQAAAVFTDFVRRRRNRNVERCSTPMGFKQIKHDLLDDPPDWRLKMMRFEKEHFRRAIPLKVQLLRHYDHRFAFLDVVFVALRRSNDFRSRTELSEMTELLKEYIDPAQLRVPHPLIFAEVFIRFRRDYSVEASKLGNVRDNNRCMGQWLVSTYKVVRFDILNQHPLFDIPEFEEWMPPVLPRMGRSFG